MTAPVDLNGTWRGLYFYNLEQQQPPDGAGVPFKLHLRQAWWQKPFGWFLGTVTDDPPHGMPGLGRIRGSFRGETPRFTKFMPVSYVTRPGAKQSLREHLNDLRFDPGDEIPHRPIRYRGRFTAADSAAGTWRIAKGTLHLTARLHVPMLECTGIWTLTR